MSPEEEPEIRFEHLGNLFNFRSVLSPFFSIFIKKYIIYHVTSHSRHQSLGSTRGSGKLCANMNAPIRDAFDCSSRKPMRRQFVSGFPRALLFLGQAKSSGVEIGHIRKLKTLPICANARTMAAWLSSNNV